MDSVVHGVAKSQTGLSDFPFQGRDCLPAREGVGQGRGEGLGPSAGSTRRVGKPGVWPWCPWEKCLQWDAHGPTAASLPPLTLSPEELGREWKSLVTQGFLATCAPGWEPVTRDVTSDGLSG